MVQEEGEQVRQRFAALLETIQIGLELLECLDFSHSVALLQPLEDLQHFRFQARHATFAGIVGHAASGGATTPGRSSLLQRHSLELVLRIQVEARELTKDVHAGVKHRARQCLGVLLCSALHPHCDCLEVFFLFSHFLRNFRLLVLRNAVSLTNSGVHKYYRHAKTIESITQIIEITHGVLGFWGDRLTVASSHDRDGSEL